MIRTKSVHTPIDPHHDGLRILASRFRGRGLTADHYDLWMPNLAPSESLLHDFLDQRIDWREFSRSFKAELRASSAAFDEANPYIKNHGQKFTLRLLQKLAETRDITLMCHCEEDEPHCHRHILAEILARPIT